MDLPVELQLEIFYKLPVRSLLICKCVCKLFYTVIQNPDFEHTHRTRTLNRSIPSIPSACTSDLLLVQSDQDINIVSVDSKNDDMISSTPLTTIIPYIRRLILVGSCNGLVCFSALTKRKWDNTLLLWNPVTRKIQYLPEPPRGVFHQKFSTEFCFVPETNEYIVLIIGVQHRGKVRVAVYKMSTDSWKIHRNSMIIDDYIKRNMTPVFVNGSFHWGVIGEECYIISYNPKDEEFGQIKTPFNHRENAVRDTEWKIAVIEGSLGIMYWNFKVKGEVQIFKMKDYQQDHGSWLYFRFRNSLLSPLLGCWKGDQLITTDYCNLYLYDRHTHKRKQWIPESGVPRLCHFLDTMAP